MKKSFLYMTLLCSIHTMDGVCGDKVTVSTVVQQDKKAEPAERTVAQRMKSFLTNPTILASLALVSGLTVATYYVKNLLPEAHFTWPSPSGLTWKNMDEKYLNLLSCGMSKHIHALWSKNPVPTFSFLASLMRSAYLIRKEKVRTKGQSSMLSSQDVQANADKVPGIFRSVALLNLNLLGTLGVFAATTYGVASLSPDPYITTLLMVGASGFLLPKLAYNVAYDLENIHDWTYNTCGRVYGFLFGKKDKSDSEVQQQVTKKSDENTSENAEAKKRTREISQMDLS